MLLKVLSEFTRWEEFSVLEYRMGGYFMSAGIMVGAESGQDCGFSRRFVLDGDRKDRRL